MIVNKTVYKFLLHLGNEILPALFWVLLLFGFDKPYVAIITLLSALLHELGHYAAINATKCDTGAPLGHFSGFRIREKRLNSYMQEILIFASGPANNLAVFFLLLPFFGASGYLTTLGLVNLATALSNLLPIKGYDGYGIIREIFRMRGCDGGVRFLDSLSFALSSLFAIVALYFMYYHDFGYWIYGVFGVIIITEMHKTLKNDVF